jgi:Flp pilus assembly protein TadG
VRRDESGQVTAFVVVFFVALVALAGLVIDGGEALAAKRRAIDEAASAARAGAQAVNVDVYRSTGSLSLDPVAARDAALAYLARTGDTGTVSVVGDTVTVTVRVSHDLTLLPVVGLRRLTLTGTGTAHVVHGIDRAEP